MGDFKVEKNKVVKLLYTNYKGETKVRTVQPIEIWFGSTEYHEEKQWLIKVYDLDKSDYRDYAVSDIEKWGVTD